MKSEVVNFEDGRVLATKFDKPLEKNKSFCLEIHIHKPKKVTHILLTAEEFEELRTAMERLK